MKFYTLMELIVVLIIISLIMVVVIPKLGLIPRGVRERRIKSELRIAFSQAALRARGLGKVVGLTLQLEEGIFKLEEVVATTGYELVDSTTSPISANDELDESEPKSKKILESLVDYKISKEVKWKLADLDLDEEETISYTFFPNGEATGPKLKFIFSRIVYELSVDALTGTIKIIELKDIDAESLE